MPMASVARRQTVLIVLHQEHSTPGRIGAVLRAMGARLDIRRPSLGDPLPGTLAGHDGVIVFGGPMGANDTLDWVRQEIDWLETPLAAGTPTLGVCLGAQMLARALGARVFSYEDKRSEIGYYPIKPTPAGDGLCGESSRARSINGIPTASTCPRVRAPGRGRREFPQPGLSPRPSCGRPPVPPGGHLSHDVPLDPSRRRAPDPARRAQPPGASRRLVPARRPGGRLAPGVPAGLARRTAPRLHKPKGAREPRTSTGPPIARSLRLATPGFRAPRLTGPDDARARRTKPCKQNEAQQSKCKRECFDLLTFIFPNP